MPLDFNFDCHKSQAIEYNFSVPSKFSKLSDSEKVVSKSEFISSAEIGSQSTNGKEFDLGSNSSLDSETTSNFGSSEHNEQGSLVSEPCSPFGKEGSFCYSGKIEEYWANSGFGSEKDFKEIHLG